MHHTECITATSDSENARRRLLSLEGHDMRSCNRFPGLSCATETKSSQRARRDLRVVATRAPGARRRGARPMRPSGHRRAPSSRSSMVSATTSVSSPSAFLRRERVGSSTSLMSSRTSSSGIRRPARYTRALVPPERAFLTAAGRVHHGGLVGRNQYERALLRHEEIADALGAGWGRR